MVFRFRFIHAPLLATLVAIVSAGLVGSAHAQATPPAAPAVPCPANEPNCQAMDQAAKQALPTYQSIAPPVTTYADGGENGAGVIGVNGVLIDGNKLIPGANKTKSDALKATAGQGGSLDTLHTVVDAQDQADKTDPSVAGQAWSSVQSGAHNVVETTKAVRQDNAFWANSLDAMSQAQAGNASGQPVGSCTTTNTPTPVQSTGWITTEKVCDIIKSPGNGPVCTRAFEWQTGASNQPQSQTANLDVDSETGGLVCGRLVTASGSTTTQPGTQTNTLAFPNESGGAMCTRTRVASQQSSWVDKAVTSTVAVDTQVGGQVCSRQRWVKTTTSDEPGSQDATLAFADESSGNVCKRTRTPTGQTSSVTQNQVASLNIDTTPTTTVEGSDWQWPTGGTTLQAGTISEDLPVDPGHNGLVCSRTVWPSNTPSSVPGSLATDLAVNSETSHNLCLRTVTPITQTQQVPQTKAATIGVDMEQSGQVCTRTRWPASSITSSPGAATVTLTTYPLGSNGLLGSLKRWPSQAPGSPGNTTSPTVSQSRGTGFPYEPTGSHSGTVSLDLSGLVPAGAPAISGFGITTTCNERVSNPFGSGPPYVNIACGTGGTHMNMQVTVTQVPSAANQWIAQFAWKDLNAATASTNSGYVAIAASWTVPGYTATSGGTYSTTDGTANIYGGTATLNLGSAVGASMLSIAQLHVDASCTQAGPFHQSSPCGSGTTNGATLGWALQYNVTITQQPTLANGWVAMIHYAASSTCPLCSGGAMTFTAQWLDGQVLNTTFTTVATPGTIQTGTNPPCTASYTCTVKAPANVNGVAVIPGMVSGLPALYSGALPTCLAANNNQTCSAPQTVVAIVDLSAKVPVGTTALANLTFTVSNPQVGVAITLATAPTAANGWKAIFNVTKSRWTADTIAPQLALAWTAQQTSVAWSLKETGNCSAHGTASCPAQWSCTQSPPATVNGIAVTDPMVSGLAALYPSASATCIAGALSTACTGNATTTTQVSIASVVPATAKTIDGFTFVVNNPQPGVTVVLTSQPTLANQWVATFTSQRTDWTAIPVKPQLSLNWTVSKLVTSTVVKEIGNCNDPGTTSCPARWSCPSKAPTVVDGVTVTAAMAEALAPLYPSAPQACVIGSLDAACGGASSETSTVTLVGHLPAGTTAISGFGFVVANPQTGVTVALVSAPTLANQWVATFSVKRTEWTSVPVAPHITLSWTAAVPGITAKVVETGDCNADSGGSCPSNWSCTTNAPATEHGLTVTPELAAQFSPLYQGASTSCVVGRLRATCSGNGALTKNISIASLIPPGAKAIQDFAFTVTNPQASVVVELTTAPTLANQWTATFTITRTSWTDSPVQPHITMTWNAALPSMTFSIKSSGDITATGTAACPVGWSCTQSAPATINGLSVTPAELVGQPVLYPGAATSCLKANLTQQCGGTLVKNTVVSIAAQIPAGTTSISNFGYTIGNPQPGVSIALKTAPSAANAWKAVFSVSREAWVTTPAKPSINLSWQVMTTTYTFANVDVGNCAAPGNATCPSAWSCTTAPPATINNVDVTAAMVAGLPPLFTGDTATCLVGSLDKSCSGTTVKVTKVNIAAQIPAGTTVITGVGFVVVNPQDGVVVSMASKPNLANGWVATMRVTQSGWSVPVVAPNVHITWSVKATQNVFSVVDTGNCSTQGTAACPVNWACSASAPATINGVAVTPDMLTSLDPLYPSGATACVTANLTATCGTTTLARGVAGALVKGSGTASALHAMASTQASTQDSPGDAVTISTIDISGQIPSGTTTIQNVTLTVNNPQAGIAVVLTDPPTLANHWLATVQVTRTDFSYVPVQPSVTIGFQVPQPGLSFTVADTGDCSAAGTANCPAKWSCTVKAPTTLNGLAVSISDVKELAELYAGAAPACVTGALSTACSGADSISTDISIAAAIPPGVTTITAFNFKVSNPQTGVAVKLLVVPSASNNWVASFQVTRNYTTSGSSVVAPTIVLTWNDVIGTITLGTSDTGNCATTNTASCSAAWACNSNAPATISGINVTGTMLSSAGVRLFPGDTADTCVDASLNRSCSGSGSTTTTVSIAAVLPSGTTVIQNFTWSVTTAVAGVEESLVSAPSLANNWVATFSTTRTDWSTPPSGKPVVTLTWGVAGSGQGIVPVDSGNCSVTGDSFCSTQWMCTAYASTTPTSGGTSEQDIPGQVIERLVGTPTGKPISFSIASLLPQGTTNLTGVVWRDLFDPQGGGGNCGTGPGQLPCAVIKPQDAENGASATLVTAPTLANNWTATVLVISPCTDGFCTPDKGLLSWVAVIPGTPGGGTTGSGGITTGDLNGVPPIYPGAPANCIAAQLAYSCSTINNGTVCHTDATGQQVCDSVVGGAFDGCGAERADPTCTLARTVCTADAQNANGFCYIENQVYECKTPVTGTGTGVTSTTQCTMNLPVCTTAGCTQQYSDTSTGSAVSASHAAANLAVLEDINSDYVDANTPGGTGGGGPGGGGTGGGGGHPPGGGNGGPVVQSSVAGQAWTPWTAAANTSSTSSPGQAGSISPPPGWDPAKMTFFNGSEQSCMKVLGGLLNCCTKQAPVDGNVAWWQTFAKQLRSGWAGVASCAVAPGGTPPANSQGSWATAKGGASMGSLSKSFTSSLENLTGNGLIPACATTGTTTMQSVEQSFEAQADQTIIPNLGWYCNSSEEKLAVRKRLGECEYLGDYCKASVLGFCLDKRQRYCCFNSQMSLMLREQLNKQGVIGFGTAKDPQCNGPSVSQMQQMDLANMDTTSLEGNMIEAGAVPDVSQLMGASFMQQFTGSGSDIGNSGRQDLLTRTLARTSQVDTDGAVTSIEQQAEGFVPPTGPVQQPTPSAGNITIQNAMVSVVRGKSFSVQLTRNGGLGQVSVQVTAVPGTATKGIDYAFTPDPQTVTWSAGDTSVRTITVFTYVPVPAVTTPRSFEIHLLSPSGGATIYPTGIQQITIIPQP